MPEYPKIPDPRAVAITDRLVNRYFFTPDPEDEVNFVSYLGTPVYSPLEFLKTSGTSLDNSLRVIGQANGNSETILRIDTVLMIVTQAKNIVKTPIAGRDGEVMEYVSKGNFRIDIRGLIVSQYPNVYPRDEVGLLVELLDLPKTIPIASEFLSIFGIESIVVDSYTVSQKMGSRNEVPFEIQALSDLAQEIILNPNDTLNG